MSRKSRDEQGAVAIMVAAFLVALCVIGAFVTDFGMAYVNKRQAQVAADAGVLAAAKIYATKNQPCPILDTPGTVTWDAAETAANKLREQNMPGSEAAGFNVSCNANSELVIDYDVRYDSPVGLGQLVIDDDSITVQRTAQATFDRPLKGESGMRPWPLCSNAADFANPAPGVVRVVAGNATSQTCPAMDAGGVWERLACPGWAKGTNEPWAHNDPTSSNYWIRYGCPNPASPVPGQPTNATLATFLSNYCTGLTNKNMPSLESCLTRDSGNSQNAQMLDAWQQVVNDQKTMEVPLYCDVPECTASSVRPIQNGVVIPIWRMAVVRLCGVYLGGTATTWSAHADCNGSNDAQNYRTSMALTPGGKSAFYVVIKGIVKGTDDSVVSGSSNLRLTK